MNITVIGASSGLGLEVVKRALRRNHRVTALSRSGVDIPENAKFADIQGNALIKPDLQNAIQNADAVLVSLGTHKNMKATTLFSDFAKVLVEIHNETSITIPVILVTGFGTGESQKYVGWFVKLFIKYLLKDVYADKAIMEEIIVNSGMKWIVVRPGRLLDNPVTEKYRTETNLFKGINIGNINRSDVADYMVKQAENPRDLGKYVGISNA